MFKDFFTGASFVFRGWESFCRYRKTWRYAIIPLIAMLFFYIAAFAGLFSFAGKFSNMLAEQFAKLPEWLSFLSSFLNFVITAAGVITLLLLLSAVFSFIYELFGSLFFDALTSCYEKERYGTVPREMSFSENVKYALSSMRFGLRSAMIFVILFIISLLFPIAGQIILVLVMGYHFGVSYMISTAVNNHLSIKELEKLCSKKSALVVGFGSTAYLLLSIPLTTIFCLPALVLGASELFNEEIKKELY